MQALIVLLKPTKDVGELQNAEHAAERERNRKMFMLVLNNIRFLTWQGLALRGSDDELNSNFTQLLHLHANEYRGVDVGAWLERRANK